MRVAIPSCLTSGFAALAICVGAHIAAPLAGHAQVRGFEPSFVDTTCSPCRDFYQFANGAWLGTASFPAAFNTIGVRRDMEENVAAGVHRVLDAAAASPRAAQDPLGTFYQSCMDSARADRLGPAAIAGDLKRISSLATREALARELARMQLQGIGVPFLVWPEPDPKASTSTIAGIGQGGLGLPDRDFYLSTDSEAVALRQQYLAHIERTFRLLGAPRDGAKRTAQRVLAFETGLAAASMTAEALREVDSTYHMMTVRELDSIAPALRWKELFTTLGLRAVAAGRDSVDVGQPTFLGEVGRRVAAAPLLDWREYLTWHLANALSPYLGEALFAENFEFDRLLSGVSEPLPRWRRCAEASDFSLPDAIWEAYVTTYLSPAAQPRVSAMIEQIRAAFRARISGLAWMGDSTRAEATQKLDAVLPHVGYPDHYRDYTTLGLSIRDPFPANLLRALAGERRRQLAQIGQPVDRNEWGFTAMTVDAFYNGGPNGIFILPGMLQPPRFDPTIDEAVGYGSLGTLIGHEFTHGFDDQGRRFDSHGDLRDWWTVGDAERYEQLSQRIVDRYSAFVAVDSLHVNGRLTLGENIADIGGLAIAYDAFQRAAAAAPPVGLIDGFTPEQRFFLGYAQGWRRLYRPETMRMRTLTDPHSPPAVRINATVMNFEAFARAFGCKPGDPMALPAEQRTAIW
jgi:putative endopeptidase